SMLLVCTGMGAVGFEPTKANANRFTVCPVWPLRYTPVRRPSLYGDHRSVSNRQTAPDAVLGASHTESGPAPAHAVVAYAVACFPCLFRYSASSRAAIDSTRCGRT